MVLALADCFFFIRPDLLMAQSPVFVGLDSAAKTVMAIDDESELGQSLWRTHRCLWEEISTDATSDVIVLADALKRHNLAEMVQLPTLAGMLLGYPVVYAVRDMDDGHALARALSAQGMMLNSMSARLFAGGPRSVNAYTVPLSLADSCSAMHSSWKHRATTALTKACENGWNWVDISVESKAQPPRPVVL